MKQYETCVQIAHASECDWGSKFIGKVEFVVPYWGFNACVRIWMSHSYARQDCKDTMGNFDGQQAEEWSLSEQELRKEIQLRQSVRHPSDAIIYQISYIELAI